MSQLIFRAWHNEQTGKSLGQDEIITTFDGSPANTLGLAIAYFTEKSRQQCERIVNGDLPDAPDIIKANAQKYLATPIAERNQFTVVQTADGFKIWISDGPDQYDLVD